MKNSKQPALTGFCCSRHTYTRMIREEEVTSFHIHNLVHADSPSLHTQPFKACGIYHTRPELEKFPHAAFRVHWLAFQQRDWQRESSDRELVAGSGTSENAVPMRGNLFCCCCWMFPLLKLQLPSEEGTWSRDKSDHKIFLLKSVHAGIQLLIK